MPRAALANVSTTALQAEIERRVSKLAGLLKLRDDVDRQVAELKALAGQFVQAAPAGAKAKPGRKRGRKPRTVAKKKTAAAKKGQRTQYAQTATEFVLGLLQGGKVLTSQELGQAWTDAGRKGMAAKTLGELVAEKKLARRKIRGKKGSKYRIA